MRCGGLLLAAALVQVPWIIGIAHDGAIPVEYLVGRLLVHRSGCGRLREVGLGAHAPVATGSRDEQQAGKYRQDSELQ